MAVSMIMAVSMVIAVPMVVIVVSLLMQADTVVVVAVAMVLAFHHLVAFEQTHTQQQRQRHLTLDRPQDAGFSLDLSQALLQLLQALLGHEIAFVEQQHVAVDDLGARHLTL